MTLLKLLERRRSCRKFTDQRVEKPIIDKLVRSTLTAPSSKNTRSTRLAVIDNLEIIDKLATIRSYGSAFLSGTPLVIAVMADVSLSDLWVENCTISATILQLEAESLGLASCWVHVNGRPHHDDLPQGKTAEEYIHEILPSLADYRFECLIAIGYPFESARPHKDSDNSNKVIYIG